MELTLKQVVEAFEAIKKLSDVPAGNGISIKQAYWLSRLLVEVETEIKRIENLRLQLLLQNHESNPNMSWHLLGK